MSEKNKSSSFLTQAVILASAGLLVKIIGFLYRLPMTNMMGDEGNGIYSAGYNIYNFFLILSSAGLPAAISRMVSSRLALEQYKNAHKVFRTSLIYAAVFGFFGSAVLFICARPLSEMLRTPEAYYSIMTLAPTVFIVAIMSVYRGYFQGMNNTVPTAFSQIVEQMINAVFSIWLVYIFYRQSLSLAAAGGTAATGIGALSGLLVIIGIYFRHHRQIKENVISDSSGALDETSKKIAKELVMTAFPIIAGTAIYSMTSLIDTNMVKARLLASGAYTDAQATALFGQLTGKYVTLTNLPVAISSSMATAVIPSISASVALKDKKGAEEKINMAIRLAMVISVPAAFGVGIFAEEILSFLFPNANEGAALLQAGFISIIFFSLSQICTGVLQGSGNLKVPVIAAFIGCVIKIPVNYVLLAIPSINIIGAIIGTTFCYMAAASINAYYAYKFTGSKMDFKGVFLKPVFASVLMSTGCLLIYKIVYKIYPSNSAALLSAILIGAVVYLVTMLFIKGITKEDMTLIPGGKKLSAILEKIGM